MVEAQIYAGKLQTTSAALDRHAEELRDYALTILKEWQATTTWQPAPQLNAASRANARDYRGRSLLELLQNAHDAHPGDRHDGRVHILLDETEGAHGTLYVANGGSPFTWDSVMAICKFAMSEKTVGDGIGNKGVGFRSVLELTEAPEIYSDGPDEPASPKLGGYRFRFATRDDLLDLLQDPALATRAAEEFPAFQVPFPISELPRACRDLAADGHVTIVRLPLKNERARDDAARLWRELALAEVPVLLFLSRLNTMVLEHCESTGTSQRIDLTREELRLEGPWSSTESDPSLPAVSFAQVNLGDLGQFMVTRGRVPLPRLRETVTAAVSQGDLDESWHDWSEPAVVEIALPTGKATAGNGRIYTFLPLGDDVEAPLPGHINAPFFTSVDRTALDRGHDLNAMLFTALAETALVAAEQLREMIGPGARQMAVDLVSWDAGWAGLVSAAAHRVHDCDFLDVPVVPILDGNSPSVSWGAPRSAVRWPSGDLVVLTAAAALDVGIVVADSEVASGRLTRLLTLCKALGRVPTTYVQLAGYVERVVVKLPIPHSSEAVGVWDNVYVDLYRLFKDHGDVLRGRKLLLADDGRLRHFNGSSPQDGVERGARHEAFFQPTSAEAAGLNGLPVPRTLKKRLFYIHPALQLANETQQQNRQVHRFLTEGQLVRTFDIKGLLDHIGHALGEGPSDELRIQALGFVCQLHRSRQGVAQPSVIRNLGLYVPTESGKLLPVEQTVFGKGWSNTQGNDLATVVAEGRGICLDLKAIEEQFVVPPQRLVELGGSPEDWRIFLQNIGVNDGLVPVSSQDAVTTIYGSALGARFIVANAKASREVVEQWEPTVRNRQPSTSRSRTWFYGTPAFRLPGQGVVATFSQQGRLAYARLMLHGLSRWNGSHFASRWTSDNSRNQQVIEIPTPMAAFLRGQSWLPVRNRDRSLRFVTPAAAWHIPDDIEDEPSFIQPVPHNLRSLVKNHTTRSRLREFGMPTWGAPEDSARLIATLGELVSSGSVEAYDRLPIQRANQHAWEQLTARARSYTLADTELLPLTSTPILVEVGDALDTISLNDLRDGKGLLYVSDERDSLTVQFIRETENALLVVPGTAKKATELLARLCPGKIKHVDAAALSVHVDDQPLNVENLGVPLHRRLSWLPYAIGVLADHALAIRPTDGELADLVAAARKVRLHGYESLAIALDRSAVFLPDRQSGILPVPDDQFPLIVAPRVMTEELTWEVLEKLAYALGHVLSEPEIMVRFRLSAHQLRNMYANVTCPTEEQLAVALEISISQYRDTVHRIEGSLAGVIERMYPVLVHSLGVDQARELVVPPPRDIRGLQALLVEHEAELPLPADELIRAARNARDVSELREIAQLDFAEFNRTLVALAPRYSPISHAEAHEEAIQKLVDVRRSELLNRLRWAFLSQFDEREPISGWADLKSLQWITAPDAWALTLDEASPELRDSHIEESLSVRLDGIPVPMEGEALPAIERLRIENLNVVRAVVPEIVALVGATRRSLPTALAGSDPVGEVATLLDRCGALDFRRLTNEDVVAWLATLSHWPAGMPTTMNPAAHDLTPALVEHERSAAARATEGDRYRRQRIVSVGDREFDVSSGDLMDLAAELRQGLDENSAIIAGNDHFANLQPLPARSLSGSRGSRSTGFVSDQRELSQDQRRAIGFAGELIAYEWLRARYQAADENIWVSSNRRHVFPGSRGDDSLGYDFILGSGQHTRMFEVKATRGDGGQIELGESEVRAAQHYTVNRRWSILVVTWVLDPERTTVTRLPNPFSTAGREKYRTEGGSLRFSYQLET
ncbi:sacsin N-terminal ATP-binding-like domain-containing protein [Nonomuraea sp. NPDC059023]|uniref:sacsin N-terminal ATP-binding-like domain-containing protein n=1 Tax=unclassified Nonomuraea TaxID=2593643 RepID=UPI0036D070BB